MQFEETDNHSPTFASFESFHVLLTFIIFDVLLINLFYLT